MKMPRLRLQFQQADCVPGLEASLVKPLHLRHRNALIVGKRTVVRQAGPSTMAGLKTGRRFDISPRAEAVQAARHVSRVADTVVHEYAASADKLRYSAHFDVMPHWNPA